MDPKDIKCPLQWWEKHETMFPIIGFLACQILNIVGSQIEFEFFSLVNIFRKKIKCHLQSRNLGKLICVNKNWPSDPRIGCKPPSNFMELIQTYLDFEEVLEYLKVYLNGMKYWTYKILKDLIFLGVI